MSKVIVKGHFETADPKFKFMKGVFLYLVTKSFLKITFYLQFTNLFAFFDTKTYISYFSSSIILFQADKLFKL
jgi:hypothetical protein